MMNGKSKGELSSYWQKLAARAEKILEKDIKDLKTVTVDPDMCLLPLDQARMRANQLTLKGMNRTLEKVRDGSKFWAFDTVWRRNPCQVFHPG